MTHTTQLDQHEPDPWFRDYLAGEMSKELRRGRRVRRVRQFVVVFAAMLVGSSVGVASAQIRQNTQRDSVLEAAHMVAGMLSARINATRAEVEALQRRFEVGAIQRRELDEARARLVQQEASAAMVSLNIAEIRETSLPPRDDLNAPTVNGRDFVKSRLQMKLAQAQKDLEMAEAAHQDAARRAAVGVSPRVLVLEADVELQVATSEVALLARKIQLRDAYVAGQKTFEEVTRLVAEAEDRHALQGLSAKVNLAQERLALISKLKAVGAADEVEMLRAELVLRETQLELQALARRLGKKP